MPRKLSIYQYPQCSTCRKALRWLKDHAIDFESIHIVEHPPSAEELKQFVEQSGLELKKFFNTSGLQYKELNLKEKLPAMTDTEKIDLLASNGKLIKRPIVTDGTRVTVGFKEDNFESHWKR